MKEAREKKAHEEAIALASRVPAIAGKKALAIRLVTQIQLHSWCFKPSPICLTHYRAIRSAFITHACARGGGHPTAKAPPSAKEKEGAEGEAGGVGGDEAEATAAT